MAEKRDNRSSLNNDIMLEAGAKIIDRLKSDKPVYFMFDDLDDLGNFVAFLKPEYHKVIRQQITEDKNNCMVVITNPWNTEPGSTPPSSSAAP